MMDRLGTYIDKFSTSYHINPDKASEYAMVREVKKYYEEESTNENDRIQDCG